MSQIHISSYKSPVGELILGEYEGKLCLADWKYRKMRAAIDKRIQKLLATEYIEKESEVCQEAILQLEQYFARQRNEFELPLLLLGTDFQHKVWDQLIEIEYGRTISYLALSKKIGDPKAIRALATASGANAVSIIVPCHRVIGSQGELTGYAGGLSTKRKLLAIESDQKELFD